LQIKKTADRLAEAGYRTLVPDFYRGKVTTAATKPTT
jgi:dienelactone hydrolase